MKFVKIPSIAITRLSVYARNLDLLEQKGVEVISSGRLADIAPTLLQMMEITPPVEMTGVSLIEPASPRAEGTDDSHDQP